MAAVATSEELVVGRTFVVTGGASGLGEATARAFHDTGANVVLVDLNLEVVPPSCCSDYIFLIF
jgi:NADP-dependent 3-hydroxy acid dehydrogenase YdfG